MRAIVFGATGMIGQGVVREQERDADVASIRLVGRSRADASGPKIEQLVVADLLALEPIAAQLADADVCFWCLGISSTGLDEVAYRRITRDYAVHAATLMAARNPAMTFVFVSGAGADVSGRLMWARVKGEAEQAILAMPFARAFAIRPAFILPKDGIRSRTAIYNAFYSLVRPIYPLLRTLAPGVATDTAELGRAMIRLARAGHTTRILEQRDVNALVRD